MSDSCFNIFFSFVLSIIKDALTLTNIYMEEKQNEGDCSSGRIAAHVYRTKRICAK